MKTQIQTIDIEAKEWFDKINGNSYYSARVVINYGTESERTLFLPFGYGYGDQYVWEGKKVIEKEYGPIGDDVIIRRSKQTKCLKRDVVAWGKKQ